jgi:hypothetical protein
MAERSLRSQLGTVDKDSFIIRERNPAASQSAGNFSVGDPSSVPFKRRAVRADAFPVDVQFWLNVGSPGWAMRLHQPLTHPYVMSRQWTPGQLWTDADEEQANDAALQALISGLLRRCRKQVYLGMSQYGEQGHEQRGQLLSAIQRSLRRIVSEDSDV